MPYLISLETFEAVRERLKSGSRAFSFISKELGVSVATVARIANGTHAYQTGEPVRPSGSGTLRKSFRAVGEQREVFLPTPEQIETECVRLRGERKPNEVDDPDGWPPPAITPGTLDQTINPNRLGLREVCERYVNEQWLPDHLNAEQSASGRQSRPRWSECERPQQVAPNVRGTGPMFHTGLPFQKARRLLIAKQSAAARGVGNIKVGFIDKDELSEKLELVKVEKLDAKEMAEVRDAAWKLEASAAERLPDVFGKAKPSERQFGKLIAENAKEIAPQEVKGEVTMW